MPFQERAGITVSSISRNTSESGQTAFFTIVLNSRPKNGLKIDLRSSDESEGTVDYSIVVGEIDSKDGDYEEVRNKAVIVINRDDDLSCPAGDVAPVKNPDVATVFCESFSQNLNEYNGSNMPSGVVLIWSSSPVLAMQVPACKVL